jgi:nucleoid-associated protein YgaU
MPRSRYTFRDYLKDRGEEDLLGRRPEPQITGLVLREVKLAAAAFLALVLAVVLVFYEPDGPVKADDRHTLRTTAPGNPTPFRPSSRVSSLPLLPQFVPPAPPAFPAVRASLAGAPPLAPTNAPPAVTTTRPGKNVRQPAPPPEITYTVRPGDTLEGISLRFYGSGRYWRRIAERNRIADPLRLRVGARLSLPSLQHQGPHR